MASTYVNNLRLEEIATGEKSGTWGSITNTNLELVGEALGYGTENLGSDANTTITVADGAADSARSFYLKITSTSLSADRTVTLAPNTVSKVWIIENATTNGKAITIKQGTGATITIPNGDVKVIATDGAGSGAAVYDLLVDLNIATQLTIKNPSTSDDTPATLLLQTGDTDIAADDKLGVINFQAPDEGTGTDAVLVAAGIEAVSEGDFSSSSNATKLSFKTASSEAAAEKMSLSSAGLLTIADDLVIGDGKTIGSASDTDAITIASNGETTFSQDVQVDDLTVRDGGHVGSVSNATALSIAANGEATFSQDVQVDDMTVRDGGHYGSVSNATAISVNAAGAVTMTQSLTVASGTFNPGIFIGDAAYKIFVNAGKLTIQNNTNGVELGSGSTSWASASDERKKDIIENIENGLTKVNGLRAVIGKYKTETDVRRSFLIAQDVQAVLPEAVDASDSDNLALRYTDVIPLLVASIKELKAKVESLEAEITTLKGSG